MRVYWTIPPVDIEANPRQPRQVFDDDALAELEHSIREFGLLQPIVVRADQRVSGRRALPDRDGRAALARRARGRPGDGSRRSSVRPPTTRCSATPCWRTSTASSSTPWKRRRPTSNCSRSSGSTHDELAIGIGRSRPGRHQHDPAAQAARSRSSVGSRRACCRRSRARRCSGWTTPRRQEELASRIVAEGLSVRATEEAVTVANLRPTQCDPPSRRTVTQADSDAGFAGRWPNDCRTLRHPRDGDPRPTERADRRRVRSSRRSGTHHRDDDRVQVVTPAYPVITSL